jgi:hypothetical protein
MPVTPPSNVSTTQVCRRTSIVLVASAALILGQAGAVASAATTSSSSPAKHHRAPVMGAAASGGAVIVWLKDQHSNLNLRTQAQARADVVHADQQPIVDSIRGGGGTDIVQLVSVNAVAAHVSPAEVQQLRSYPSVKRIIPDATFKVGDPETRGPQLRHARIVPDKLAIAGHRSNSGKNGASANSNPFPTANNCGTIDNPLIEPEALDAINAPAMTNTGLETEAGHGVIVANDGISSPPNFDLVGNPNFVRPAADGGGSVVVGAEPGDTTDATDGEYYGDASSIAAQGTVEYQYAKELPYSGMPDNCYFKLVGDAPGSSLVDTENIDTPESSAADKHPATKSESEIIAGIDAAVIEYHADVINESYGYSNSPGSYAIHYAANDAAVDAGVTVVASSGDSGVSGTVSSPASDPKIIAVGATNTLRLNAMAYGFTGWVNNDITPLSSGGATPEDKVVDLVAPGYGGEAACNPNGSDCPENTQTEAFGGTSESSPLVAGAAADVIQAYRDSHNGNSPSPAVVKQILTSTATDVDAPADQQGAGLLNIGAAVDAAKQLTNTTATGTGANLIASPTQLDVRGDGGSTSFQSVSLYNASSTSTSVSGSFRTLGPEQQLGDVVTEPVSAPDPNDPVPADGAQAAPTISFDVPSGLDRLDADMIWPDATNSAILSFTLIDPQGKLRQISYDYGAAATSTRAGTVPDIEHVEVANPGAGTWHAEIKWANGRSHLQELPNVPGAYTGNVQFRLAGQNFVTTPAVGPVTIAAHRTATVSLPVSLPNEPGDHPQSVQFTADNGAATSVPVARRTLVPSAGGEFDTMITSSVGRGLGQISTFNINVPAGRSDLGVTLTTPDTSADDPMTLFMVNPNGTSVATHTVTSGNPPRTRTVNGIPLTVSDVNGAPMQTATFHVASPIAGTWEIDVELNLTTSGKEFRQTVVGDVLPQAPTVSAPADGSHATSQTPTISGTGATGDTVTVIDGTGATVCTAVVASDGTWTCTASTQPAGSVTFSAKQADQTGDPSLGSNAVTISIPATTSVALTADPAAPAVGQAVTLTATTSGGVPDGTTVTFLDGSTSLGSGSTTSGVATLSLPSGLGVGDHPLTASVPATEGTLASDSPVLDIVIGKSASTIALKLSKTTVAYGHAASGSITVGGADGGTATVTAVSRHISVPIDSAGHGSFTLPATLKVGKDKISAVYDGTDTVAPSGTAKATLTVTKASSTTSLKLAQTSVQHGKRDTVTIAVGGHAGGAYPTGPITVRMRLHGASTTKTTTLHAIDSGRMSFSITLPNRTGTVHVRAHYGGDSHFTASTSDTVQVSST